MEVIRIEEDREKQRIAEGILAALPEWFGIPEARAEYVRESADKIFLCAMEQEEPAGFLYLIYIIVSHFTSTGAPIGWASTTALLLLLGGMILVVLGIMGEYVGRIYMCANAAPQYVEREVIRHEGDNA